MVHVIFDANSVRLYDHEQLSQLGQLGYGSYFEGLPYQRGYGVYQRGLGIGSIFSRLLRYILPVVSSAKKNLTRVAKNTGKTVGNEALITGARILDNIAQGTNIKDAVVTETKQGARRAAQKIFTRQNFQTGSGSGIRRVSRRKTSKTKRKTSKRQKKRKITKRTKKRVFAGGKVLKSKAIKRRRRDVLGFY